MLPSKQELMAMPITLLEHQNIQTLEEEKIVQEVLDMRRASMPMQPQVYDLDAKAAFIQTKEEEDMWQKKLDERRAKFRPQAQTEESPMDVPTDPVEVPTEPVEPEVSEEPKEEPKVEAKIKQFCQYCDSKGVRHKLNCTRPR